jgi:hypothetical protein
MIAAEPSIHSLSLVLIAIILLKDKRIRGRCCRCVGAIEREKAR